MMSLAGALYFVDTLLDGDGAGGHRSLVYRINPISHGHVRLSREQRASFHLRAPFPLIFYSTDKTAATLSATAMTCHKGAVMNGPRANS